MKYLWVIFFLLIVFRLLLFISQLKTQALGDELEYLQAIKSITSSNLSPFTLYSDSAQPALNFYPAILLHLVIHVPELISLRLVVFIFSIGALFFMALLLRQKFTPFIASLSLLTFGVNPALLQFSIFGWFNIQTVFFVLLAFLALEKFVVRKSLFWLFIFVISQIFIFEGYVLGRVLGIMLFMFYFIVLRDIKRRIIFCAATFLFIIPFIFSILSNSGMALHRITSVTIILQDISNIDLFLKQVLFTLGGFFGVPDTTSAGPDNRFYAPVSIGVIPFYFSPLLAVGLVVYARKIFFYYKKNNSFTVSSVFWFLICLIVLGVNIVTVYPLNISRSLLLVPIHTFLIAIGLNTIFRLMPASRFFLVPLIVFFCVLTIGTYAYWLDGDFKQNVNEQFSIHNQKIP